MPDNPLRQHINDLATPIDPAPVVDDRSYSDLLKDRAVARRAAQANAQALETSQMQLAHAQPMADALHRMFSAYAAVLVRASDAAVGEYDAAFDAAFAAHRATTPSEVPSSHVIVERAELDALRAQVAALTEERRQLIVGFQAVNAELARRRLCSGGA